MQAVLSGVLEQVAFASVLTESPLCELMQMQAVLRVAHCCAIFLRYLGRDDHHKNPNINDRDYLVGQLTILRVESP